MVASDESSVAAARLKREDWNRTKHDPVFSEWQILVGPSDWEDHSLGKEGAERYRVHNLPKSFGPGVYELGIAVSRTGLGREVGRLNRDRIVVVYLGQADNVRRRLQRYGSRGAHLGDSYLNGQPNDSRSVSLQKGPGLFEEIFSRRCSIVFRWAPMENKREAEKTEDKLLNRFDYAWNTSNNGARRPTDILRKLDRTAANTTQFPNVVRKLLPFGQKQVGISIKARKLPSPENKLSACADEESNNFLSSVFKFSRSLPRFLSYRSIVIEENTSFCGVVLGDGSVCRRPPVDRRKRCAEHKGMQINGSIPTLVPTLVTVGKSESTLGSESVTVGKWQNVHNAGLDSSCSDQNSSALCKPGVVQTQAASKSSVISKDTTTMCGVDLGDGIYCTRQPARGRVRCDEHKGMRIRGSISESVTVGKWQNVHKAGFDSSCSDQNSSALREPGVVQTQASSKSPVVSKDTTTMCGVDLGYGIYCTRQPARGRVRCDEHKGLRVNGLVSKLAAEDKSHLSDTGSKFISCEYEYGNTSAPTCGATLHNGSQCRRQPVQGNKRCWQHKGMRADSSSAGFGSEITSLTCGVSLQNGSICMRIPAHGRKRCEQHRGRRITNSSYF
ncbi:protein EFFECTOR OF TRANSCRIPTION 2-like isoform X1 [Juglans microcarpa x Juglans regia]|uniref:protein EFFECTOR OF TRANSCRIPTION 2-like isoform X1 n=1 Tax=Juglans microcarpa x Juglans regia TaxID=2249226 RepID=UPI001B7DBDBE|nr:protein EFFECTOR OF TRANSCRIPTION 2-like isoform X1 [Juglans microcarpa x Juglans regia]